MKYSNYEINEYGYSVKGYSKILEFILKLYCNKIVKRFKKMHNLPKETKVNARSEINFTIDLKDISTNKSSN